MSNSEQKGKQLEIEINRLKAQLQSTQGQLQEDLNAKIREIETLKQKISELENTLKSTRREAENTKTQLETNIQNLLKEIQSLKD